jgi:hypothetical protein
MKTTKMLTASLVAALMLPIAFRAQDKPQPKPSVPLKVDVVFSEYEGEKKISSLPYMLAVNAPPHGVITGERTSLRMGLNIPLFTDKDGHVNYESVGTDLDCSGESTEDGRFSIHVGANRSSLYNPSDLEKGPSEYSGVRRPIIRRFNASFNLLLRDGQTLENTMATDPVTGRLWKIAVTLHVVK